MTVRELFNDGLSLLGIQNPDNSPLTARSHVLHDITAALQLMQLAGEDFYCREELAISLTVGNGKYILPSTVQTVLDPARLSGGKSLIGLQSRTQLDDFGPLYLGAIGTLENGQPLAYFIEPLRESGGTVVTTTLISGVTTVSTSTTATAGAEATRITMHIVPKPSATDTLTLNVINEPPVYVAADLCGTSPVPPVPHKYHESILLPLVRKNVTLCDLFARNSAKLPLIESDYQRALVLLGLADPRQPKPPGSNVNSIRAVSGGAPAGGQPQ